MTEEEGDEVVMTEEEMIDQKDVSIVVKKVTSPEIAPSVSLSLFLARKERDFNRGGDGGYRGNRDYRGGNDRRERDRDNRKREDSHSSRSRSRSGDKKKKASRKRSDSY